MNDTTTIDLAHSAEGRRKIRQGWTPSPNARGTIDILWGSLATLFLCCWAILVVNVPKSGSTYWERVLHKVLLVGLSVLAPEIIFQIALGQWLSARRSVALFHSSGYDQWTIRHGFYANMGGLHLRTPDWVPFPIDAKQLHYLIVHHYVAYPEISDVHIRDKNKVDGMVRLITLIQTMWFVIDIILRASQNLAITALELSTAAFVMLGVATSLCWMSKPADIESPDYITTETDLADILKDAGSLAARVYYYTPLDFASREEWSWSIVWSQGLNYLRSLHIAPSPPARPVPRIQNTIVPVIDGWIYGLFVLVSLGYFAIFLAGWNFSFPTKIECVLWRAASTTSILTPLAVLVAIQFSYHWYPSLKNKLKFGAGVPLQSGADAQAMAEVRRDRSKQRNWLRALAATLSNNTLLKDPALDAPPALVLAIWFFGVFYASARAYIAVADFIELRSLPASAYDTVNWSSIWPHF